MVNAIEEHYARIQQQAWDIAKELGLRVASNQNIVSAAKGCLEAGSDIDGLQIRDIQISGIPVSMQTYPYIGRFGEDVAGVAVVDYTRQVNRGYTRTEYGTDIVIQRRGSSTIVSSPSVEKGIEAIRTVPGRVTPRVHVERLTNQGVTQATVSVFTRSEDTVMKAHPTSSSSESMVMSTRSLPSSRRDRSFLQVVK